MMPGRISIVVPSLDAVTTIDRCLSSLVAQDWPDLELICVDGGSTDGTAERIEAFGPAITTILVGSDRNIADALNKGFTLATGEFRGWLSADDEMAVGAFHRAVSLLRARPDVDLVTGGCRRVFPDGSSLITVPAENFQAKIGFVNGIEQPSTLWRAAAHERAGQLDDSFRYAFDWEFWCRLDGLGARFARLPDVQSTYFFSHTNMTSRGGNELVQEMYRVVKAYGPRRGLTAELYRFLYAHFDLAGYYDRPPVQSLPARMRHRALLGVLALFFGIDVVRSYNWSFAARQVRGLKWYVS